MMEQEGLTVRGVAVVAVKAAVTTATVLALASVVGVLARRGDQVRLAVAAARMRRPRTRQEAAKEREVAEFRAAVSRYDHGPRG